MLIWLFGAVHVVVCFLLIVVVLLQKGKGQDFASTFGGGGTQTAFGARSGATILHRATTAAAVIFMLTSLTLTILMSRSGQESVLGGEVSLPEAVTPAAPVSLPLPGAAEDAGAAIGDEESALEAGEPAASDVEETTPEE